MANNNANARQAIDDQNVYIRDTLMSIASSYADTLRDAVNSAFDSAEAGTLSAVGRDLTRSFTQLAKMSDEFALNQGKITAGILKEKDVAKQLQTIAEKRESLDRKMLHARQLGVDFSEEDYQAALRSLDLQEQMLTQDQEQLANIEKSIGLTGKLVQSLGKIPGIGQFLQAEEIEVAMRKAAAAGAGSFKTMGIAASMVGSQLAAGLTDPLFIIGEIFKTYLAINKASVDVQRLTGQNAVTAASWNTSLASAKDYLETVSELTAQTGRNAQNVFSQDVLAGAAELKVTMGLAADEAGGIATMAQTSGRSVDSITKSVVSTTSAFNKANRSAVSQGVVLKEVAKASDSIKLSLANNPEALAKAASAATKLGMSLQDVDNIASSLLNFEDSISNELEAELLIGKDLNLEKARELALSNDLAGLGEELFKNSADIAEFGKMNRIQQEAQAKALGMTRDQLAKVAYQRALDANMTEEQAAAAAGVNAEDMKRISAQENFAKALEKIAGAVAPILDVIGSILSIPLAPYLLIGIALSGKMLKNFSGIFDSIKGIAGGAKDMASGLGKSVADKGATAAKAVPSAPAGGGLVESFSKIDTKALIRGAAAMAIASVGIYVFAKAAQELAKIEDWGNVAIGLGAFAVSMGVLAAVGTVAGPGLTALGAALQSFGMAMITGYGAVGLAALTVSAIGLGYALNLAAPGIQAFGTVVTAVFAGIASLIPIIVDGFVNLISTIVDGIGPMLLLGPALFGIAAGLGALSLVGFTALPAIAGLVTLSAAAPALTTLATAVSGASGGSVGESKSKADEGSLAAVEARLSELVAAVKAGGNVYIDSNKVGRAQVLGSYKSA